jgi:hypothetical protein
MTLQPGPPPDRRKRLLAFADELAEELEALDIDAIDGEFYWRWCRADLLAGMERLSLGLRPVGGFRTGRQGPLRNEDDAHAGRIEPEGVFDFLREGLRFADDVMTVADEAARLYPRTVWQRLLEGERVAMRAAETEFRVDASGGTAQPPILRLKVFSGAWTGKHVEEEARRTVNASRYGSLEAPHGTYVDVSVRLSFAFGDEARARGEATSDDHPRFPYILVEVPLPLPPEQTIAREYEALVRVQRGWHLDLPGSGSRQEKEVAIRTWTIGLLVATGMAVNDAIEIMHLQLNLGDITQTRFGQDRKRLLERVPEAGPYLFSRAGTQEATRATEPDALVPPSEHPFLTQPPDPDSHLYP